MQSETKNTGDAKCIITMGNLFQICFFEIIDFSIILGFASAEDAKNTT